MGNDIRPDDWGTLFPSATGARLAGWYAVGSRVDSSHRDAADLLSTGGGSAGRGDSSLCRWGVTARTTLAHLADKPPMVWDFRGITSPSPTLVQAISDGMWQQTLIRLRLGARRAADAARIHCQMMPLMPLSQTHPTTMQYLTPICRISSMCGCGGLCRTYTHPYFGIRKYPKTERSWWTGRTN